METTENTPTATGTPVSAIILAPSDTLLKALSMVAASTLFAAPQFTNQANPTNILGMADLMFQYMQGKVTMTPPEMDAVEQGGNPPTFG